MSSPIQLRLFRCHECGHKMRANGDICGRCHAMKPAWHGVVYRLVLLAPAILIGIVGIAVLARV